MQEIYEKWLSCNENWKSSSWVLSLQTSSTDVRKGARRWMTHAQIASKYNDTLIADEIVQTKMGPDCEHQRKPHPDLPNRDVSSLL